MSAVRQWGRREYEDALAEMRALRAARRRGEIPDTLLLVEHPPVLTVGVQGAGDSPLPAGIPVVHVERGGHVTYHGPGQLSAYSIVDLDSRGRDVRRFVTDLEELAIRAAAEFDVTAVRVAGQRGVWVGERKIASVGVAVEEWVTSHGIALNVTDEPLSVFRKFRPCGLSGESMTSLSTERGRPITVAEVVPVVEKAWTRAFGKPAIAELLAGPEVGARA
ncbi:MAG: lipoyl(octanoyl) transferase LipB [Thermoplasmata archaeon]|nr:lipoyl(octanoyl) transferase LipB [Thermoplasmata archaeon]